MALDGRLDRGLPEGPGLDATFGGDRWANDPVGRLCAANRQILLDLLYLTAGWMFASKHFILSKIMLGLAVISIGIGFYRAWKRGRPKQTAIRA